MMLGFYKSLKFPVPWLDVVDKGVLVHTSVSTYYCVYSFIV